ncbi:MBL fold metallo-hydrolase [Roseobacter fucihabitans]|nr:MBL fold metallo-hydrolase [Roseobacter litoralis]
MVLSRRRFLHKAAGLAAGSVCGMTFASAHAEIHLGDIRLDVVKDGSLTLPGALIFDPMPQADLNPILKKYQLSATQLTRPCNVTVMRQGERTILFDVGAGAGFSPDTGQLLASLDSLDIAPEDVTDVVFTHAHPDHLWGVLDDFDDPLFNRARYMIGTKEWDYWLNPNTVTDIGEARASFAVGAERRLRMIEDNVQFFGDGDEILPGVVARATYGHTPGHMSFEVRDGSTSVMILGDCIGNHHVAFERPDWPSGADHDQTTAARTRLSLLDQLAHEQIRIIGFHLVGDGIGHVDKTPGGYRFVPEGL